MTYILELISVILLTLGIFNPMFAFGGLAALCYILISKSLVILAFFFIILLLIFMVKSVDEE